jgi:hypothetical protein
MVKEEFVTPANLGLVQVARDAEEALLWIEQQRDKASINENTKSQNSSGLKP